MFQLLLKSKQLNKSTIFLRRYSHFYKELQQGCRKCVLPTRLGSLDLYSYSTISVQLPIDRKAILYKTCTALLPQR